MPAFLRHISSRTAASNAKTAAARKTMSINKEKERIRIKTSKAIAAHNTTGYSTSFLRVKTALHSPAFFNNTRSRSGLPIKTAAPSVYERISTVKESIALYSCAFTRILNL